MEKSTTNKAFWLIAFLFFALGFITCLNDILIPFLKRMFLLNYFQSMLVQFAFFGAYFVASLIYFLISLKGKDPILALGYKNTIVYSLILSGIGCFCFYPAATFKNYSLFLISLFILALGFAFLQIAINPYVAILGSPQTASSRLNLSQAFNSFATAISPIIGGYIIFRFFANQGNLLTDIEGNNIQLDGNIVMTLAGIQLPYLGLGALLLVLGLTVFLIPLPAVVGENQIKKHSTKIWHYPHLMLGVLAIFMYVGGEVTIGSFLVVFQQEYLSHDVFISKSFLAFYWGGAMVGRFLGAIALSNSVQNIFQKWIKMTLIAISIFIFLIYSTHLSFFEVVPFLILLALHFLFFYLGKSLPSQTLFYFALAAVILLAVGVLSSGKIALWCFIGVGLFNSIMFPTIFTLAIANLRELTSQGSSLLVMAILGGAIVPLIQGFLADHIGVHSSFIVPITCYLYLVFYGKKGYQPHHAILE